MQSIYSTCSSLCRSHSSVQPAVPQLLPPSLVLPAAAVESAAVAAVVVASAAAVVAGSSLPYLCTCTHMDMDSVKVQKLPYSRKFSLDKNFPRPATFV